MAIICLQETRVDSFLADRLKIRGYDIVSYNLHGKYGRAIYVKSDTDDMEALPTTLLHAHCDIRIGLKL